MVGICTVVMAFVWLLVCARSRPSFAFLRGVDFQFGLGRWFVPDAK